jgi:hypothetical protein
MTALQSIIKEAKAIRKKSPKIEWKKAVAQASAIYASKHKGKSPIGKKHAVKKKAAKKKAVGKVDPNKAFKKQMQVSKTINSKYKNWEYPVPPVYTGNWSVTTWSEWIKKHGRKIGTVKKVGVIKKKAIKKTATKRKPTEKAVLKSIKKAVSVQKAHMGNVGKLSAHTLNAVKSELNRLNEYITSLDRVKHSISVSKSMGWHKNYVDQLKKDRKRYMELIKETKTHIVQLKKHI